MSAPLPDASKRWSAARAGPQPSGSGPVSLFEDTSITVTLTRAAHSSGSVPARGRRHAGSSWMLAGGRLLSRAQRGPTPASPGPHQIGPGTPRQAHVPWQLSEAVALPVSWFRARRISCSCASPARPPGRGPRSPWPPSATPMMRPLSSHITPAHCRPAPQGLVPCSQLSSAPVPDVRLARKERSTAAGRGRAEGRGACQTAAMQRSGSGWACTQRQAVQTDQQGGCPHCRPARPAPAAHPGRPRGRTH